MPFKKIDTKKIVNEKIETDQEFAKAYEEIKKQYSLIGEVVENRKEIELNYSKLSDEL